MNMTNKRRLDDLQAILSRYTGEEGCRICGAPRRTKRKAVWLVDADRIPRCPGCGWLVDPNDGGRPVDASKIVHLEHASGDHEA